MIAEPTTAGGSGRVASLVATLEAVAADIAAVWDDLDGDDLAPLADAFMCLGGVGRAVGARCLEPDVDGRQLDRVHREVRRLRAVAAGVHPAGERTP